MPHALLVDDSPELILAVARLFEELGFSIDTADSLQDGREMLLRELPDIVLLGEGVISRPRLPKLEGILAQEELANLVEVHAVMPEGDPGAKQTAHKLGAKWLYSAPLDTAQLERALNEYLDRLNHHTRRRQVHESGRGLLVGESPPMRKLYRLIRKVAATNASVLVYGETGTGKELVARTIHELSTRSDGPFVAMNSGAIPEELAESELFGHEKGAFTGAETARDGYFTSAAGGTLFLDEITEMPEPLQVKLLRVLETGEYQRLGSQQLRTSDFRLLAACNNNPEEAMADGRLREDLFYRIAQFPLQLPPLRERGRDVELLAEHFLAQECQRNGQPKQLDAQALEVLRLHAWPGNVRELRNVIARAYIMGGASILPCDLPDDLGRGQKEDDIATAAASLAGQPLQDIERQVVLETLERCEGNKRKTAELLGISPKTLYSRLKEYAREDAAD